MVGATLFLLEHFVGVPLIHGLLYAVFRFIIDAGAGYSGV
jgi:Fe2+ transport system protein B